MKLEQYPYEFSTDYARLKKLLDEGNEIVCVVKYYSCFDVCHARLRIVPRPFHGFYDFSIRGMSYLTISESTTEEAFVKKCEEIEVGFIEPYKKE